jgi:hypothetical protein
LCLQTKFVVSSAHWLSCLILTMHYG